MYDLTSFFCFKSKEIVLLKTKIFKNTIGTTILTLIATICLNHNLAIAHETSESDVTKRCTVVKVMLDGLSADEKFPTSELKVALTPKEIYAAAGDISGHVPIALTAMVLVDGIEITSSLSLEFYLSRCFQNFCS